MTNSQTITESMGAAGDFVELPALLHQTHLEPRCRICRNDVVRKKVNRMLALGVSYAGILRALQEDNARLNPRDRISIDSIRTHTARHFLCQQTAAACYRAVLERRARENDIDFINAVGIAATPIAFFETVMARSYETLVDSHTKVDVHTGMLAASRLQLLTDSRDYSRDVLLMKVQVSKICEAVKSTVPQELWGEIIAKLEELEEREQDSEALDVGEDGFDDDDPYDPTEFIDEDDEF
jgi:hypothetical protein